MFLYDHSKRQIAAFVEENPDISSYPTVPHSIIKSVLPLQIAPLPEHHRPMILGLHSPGLWASSPPDGSSPSLLFRALWSGGGLCSTQRGGVSAPKQVSRGGLVELRGHILFHVYPWFLAVDTTCLYVYTSIVMLLLPNHTSNELSSYP